MKSLRVATCQFSVEGRIEHNRRWVLKQIAQAAEQQADVVHFSECAMSGYAGVDRVHPGGMPDVCDNFALNVDRFWHPFRMRFFQSQTGGLRSASTTGYCLPSLRDELQGPHPVRMTAQSPQSFR